MSDSEQESFIEIPRARLSGEAFDGLVEEFILREGTDYGWTELTLDEKKRRLLRLFDSGEVKIVFSTLTENCTIIKER